MSRARRKDQIADSDLAASRPGFFSHAAAIQIEGHSGRANQLPGIQSQRRPPRIVSAVPVLPSPNTHNICVTLVRYVPIIAAETALEKGQAVEPRNEQHAMNQAFNKEKSKATKFQRRGMVIMGVEDLADPEPECLAHMHPSCEWLIGDQALPRLSPGPAARLVCWTAASAAPIIGFLARSDEMSGPNAYRAPSQVHSQPWCVRGGGGVQGTKLQWDASLAISNAWIPTRRSDAITLERAGNGFARWRSRQCGASLVMNLARNGSVKLSQALTTDGSEALLSPLFYGRQHNSTHGFRGTGTRRLALVVRSNAFLQQEGQSSRVQTTKTPWDGMRRDEAE
ncbi:hypothetical protein ACJZ2D_016413 [Fusarium nematophilum]